MRQYIGSVRWRGWLSVIALVSLLGTSSRVMAQTGPTALKGKLTRIAQGKGSPDDVAVSADGTIYFGDLGVNRVLRLNADGKAEIASPVIQEPEGIVLLADGTLLVVEQKTNRLYKLDPTTQSMALFYAVGNLTRNDGIDGISQDAVSGDILLPDAPTGRILRLSADGQQLKVQWSGFVRPTSVVQASDGTMFVCDEYGGAIYRVTPDGVRTAIAHMTLPDDILLLDNGNLLVNSLSGTLWEIDPQTQNVERVVIGLRTPHGIALDNLGRVIITDAGLNAVYRLDLS